MKESPDYYRIQIPFVAVVTAFCSLICMSFYLYRVIDSEQDNFHKASLHLERVESLVAKNLFHLESYMNAKYSDPSLVVQNLTDKINMNSLNIRGTMMKVASLETASPFSFQKTIKETYFDSDYRLDENLKHFLRLSQKARLEFQLDHTSEKSKELHSLVKLQVFHIQKLMMPIKDSLEKSSKEVRTISSILLYVINFFFLLLLLFIYFVIYQPWKRELGNIEVEKKRLSSVLRESELRGNTFSWELDCSTKISKHSYELMGIFELESHEDILSVFDEMDLFDERSAKDFRNALEQCESKGEDLDVEVSLTTNNGKNYWLHYYAQPTIENEELKIVGTVRNITKQKLAEIRFESLFENSVSPSVVFAEGRIIKVNKAGVEFFGRQVNADLQGLHPGILFPLYQFDGRSSIEMLTEAVKKIKTEKLPSQDWSFKTATGEEVVGNIRLMDVPYPDMNQHMIVINNDVWRFEYDRKLVEANRRALYSRRLKLEYVTHMGVVIQNLTEIVDYEMKELEVSESGQSRKLNAVKTKLKSLWEENIDSNLEDGNNIVLTDLKTLFTSMLSRWNTMASDRGTDFKLNYPDFNCDYFWIDGQKLKLALIALVESSLKDSSGSQVSVEVTIKVKAPRQCLLDIVVYNDDPNWPGENWKKLSFSTSSEKEKDQHHLSLSKFLNVVELLQGEVYFDNHPIKGNSVGFKGYIEMAIGDLHDYRNSGEKVKIGESPRLNSADIWAHFGGDWDVIETTIRSFIDYYPVVLADMYYHLSNKDGSELYNSACDLYGVLIYFPFFSALEKLVLIQKYSQYMKFTKIEKVLNELSSDLVKLEKDLTNFTPNKKIA